MEKFTFDIQRFDTRDVSTQEELTTALNDTTVDTIKFTTSFSGNGFTVSNNVTIDFAGCTYTITDNGNITIEWGATVTLKGGTISSTSTISNSGMLTITDMTMSDVTLTSQNSGSATIKGSTSIKIAAGSSSYTYTVGSATIATGGSDGSGTLTVYTASSGAAAFFTADKDSFFTDKSTNRTYSRENTSSVTFRYDESGELSVRNLTDSTDDSGKHTNIFHIKDNSTNITKTYTVVNGRFIETNDNDDTVRIWIGDPITTPTTLLPVDDLTDDDNYTLATTISDATLEFDGTFPETPLKAGEKVIVVDADDLTKTYGTLTKSDGIYHLTKTSSDNFLSGGITISDGSTVELSSDFSGVQITVNSTEFKTTDGTKFTVTSSSDGYASIGGSSNISLGSVGSVRTAESSQTVAASSYDVYGYADSLNTNNGIIISTGAVGDIQVGESFIVNGTTYTRKEYGLTITDGDTEKVYVGTKSVDSYKAAIAVDLSNLKDSNFTNFSNFIQPEDGVLTVGGKNSLPAVVTNIQPTDDTASDVKKFGEIKIDTSKNAYTLTTIDGGNISAFATGDASISTISIAGGSTTIYKTLSDGRFIATKSGAIFTVQKVSGSTFTVDVTSNSNPIVKDATEITLYAGSIVTDKNIKQTVNLNGAQTITVTGCEMEITFDGNKTFTVNGTEGDTFTLDGKTYKIDSTDGITFTITDSDITISNLDSSLDAFTATISGNEINYSVRGAGFIKKESGSYQIWTPAKNQHSLTGASVTVASLTSADNWKYAATVDSSTKAVTLPTATFGYLVGYDDFQSRYGTFESSGNVYTIETVDATGKLSSVSVGSDVGVLSMGSGLDNVVIQSANVNLSVTDPGSDGVYDVTLTGGVGGIATVSTGEKVSLISGALKADSNVPVTYKDSILTANDDAVLTINADTSDATISALEADKSFNVGSAKYTQKKVVGLINKSGNYLFGSKQGDIKLSDINTANRWGSLVAASEFVIKADTGNALVVDEVGEGLSKLYADYEANTKTLSQSNGGEAWPTDKAITIDTTTVNFSKDFSNGKVTIHAAQSDAEFLVGDDKKFTVTDVSVDAEAGASITSYATIGNAHNITQTGGTIYITDAAQTVNTEGGTVSSAAGLTVFVSDGKTTIGAIDTSPKDTFVVATDDGTGTYTKEVVGLMDSSDNLLLNTASATAIPVVSLQSGDWHKTDAVTNNVLTLPQSTTQDDWIIIDSNKTTVYGSLTSDTDGVITVDRNDNSFAILAKTSKAQFTTDTAKFTVTDAEASASISSDAEVISLTGGIVALSDKNQSIVGGGKTINASILDETDNVITVDMTSGAAVIGALDKGEIFIVDGETYTLKENGRFQRASDGKVWNGATVSTEGGSINVASLQTDSYWNSLAQITSDSNLTIDESKTSVVSSTGDAAFIHDKNSATVIYGTFTRTGTDSYSLSTDGKTSGAEFNSVTVTDAAQIVSLTSDFKGKTIIADNTATITSTATSNFTLFYDGTVASVTGSNALTLENGTLTTDSTTQQVITAGDSDNTVKAAAGTVTVKYDGSTVTVDSIDTANDSVTVNGKTYTLTDTAGGGFKINISSGVTSLSDVGNGDKFKIGTQTFYKTSAGFFRTDDNGTDYAYMWTNTDETDVNGVDVDRLTGSDDWTAIVDKYEDGVLTIDTNSKAGILVDDVTAPTAIYGKLTSEGTNTFKLEQYASTDTKPDFIKIDTVTVTVADEFNAKPITAMNGATVNTEDSSKTLIFSTASETFTVNGTAYKMTGAGLTDTTNNKIWTADGAQKYVLPNDSAWSTLLTLDSNNNLDLTSQSAGDGSNVIVDNTSKTRYATLTYTESSNTYNFKKADGDIATIALGTGTATVTTDFATDVTAQSGTTYTVNGNTYKAASTITVAADANNSSTLDTGTVTIETNDTVTAGATTISVTEEGSSITATAAEGKWTSLGDLGNGDTFTIGNTTYKVYGTTALVTLDGDDNIAKLYGTAISNGTIAYPLSGTFSDVVQLDSEDTLDLTTDLGITKAVVVKNDDPTKKVAALEYASNAYTLTTTLGGDPTLMDYVKLGGTARTLTIEGIDATVKTDGSAKIFTVNGKPFAAQDELTIVTDQSSRDTAFLTGGTVSVAAGTDNAVTTRRTDSNNVTVNETIASTNGTVTVAVTDSTTTTIGAIDNADKFTVDGKEYLATSIGLAVEADKTLIKDAATSGTVTTGALTGAQAYVQTTDGVLTIDTSSDTALVVDITTPASAKIFGKLTKNGSAYTLTTDNKTDNLSGIEINGVTATIASDFAEIPITADGGTFTVTASGDFTINATTDPLTFSDNVTAITLTAGTLDATTSTPKINIKSFEVEVTNVSGQYLTFGFAANGKAQISGLKSGDTFTIDGDIYYKVTDAGLSRTTQDGGESDAKGYADGTFTIDDDGIDPIIIIKDDGTLDLTVALTSGTTYKVYNSSTGSRTKVAELEVSTSGTLTLNKSVDSAADYISTVAIDAGKTLNVDFATTVESAKPESSAVTTVNSVKYNATSALTIAATDGSATLTDGTITLGDTTYKIAKDTNGNTLRGATEGTFTAVAKNGSFTTISDLATNESFTYNSTTYTQSYCGIVNDDKQILDGTSGSVTINKLTTESNWTNFLAPDEDGNLNIKTATAKTLVYSLDENDLPATTLATLTVNGTTFNLAAKDADTAAENIKTVAIAAGSNLTVDFVTKVNSDVGTVTVNSREYTGTTALTLNSDGSNSTLYEGTVTIAQGGTVTATDNNALTVTAGDGITAVANGGSFTTISDLAAGDSFTYGGTAYTQSDCGIVKGSQILEDTSGSITINKLTTESNWTNFLYPKNGTLDLTETTLTSGTTYNVYDSATPSRKLGTVTKTDDAYTVDFAKPVKLSAGSFSVNGQSYTATTEAVIQSDGTTSTLTTGTVTLAQAGRHVTITDNDNTVITATTTTDGLTVRATTSSVTIGDITDGDIFTVGGDTADTVEYKFVGSALYKTDADSKDYIYNGSNLKNNSITLANLANDWAFLLEIDGNLTVAADTLDLEGDSTARLVSGDRKKIYGTLTKTDSTAYTLTASDDQLTSLTASGVSIVMDAYFKDIPTFTAGNSTFSSIALKNTNNTFTLDATGTAPKFADNVASLTLTSGNVAGVANQTVTAGERSITPTTVTGTMIIDSEEIGELESGDVFTIDDTTYKVLTISGTAQVFNATDPAIVTAGYSDDTLNFAGIAETQAVAPTNSVLALADMTEAAAIVLDSTSAPKTQLGNVTKSGTAYIVDYAAQVKTPSTAPVTVNGATYNGKALTLYVPDNTTSTLNTGTVTLDDTTYTSATADKTLTAQSGTFTATASTGTFTTVNDLQTGDSFTYDGTTYTQTNLGLMNAAGQIREDLTPDTTIDLTALATDWTDLLEVSNGAFTIEADTLTEEVPKALLVNSDHTKIYGRLTRTAEATYTLTEAGETLTKLTVNNSTVTLNPEFRTASIVANGTEISALTLNNTNLTYTLTATDTPTLSDNVTAFTLGQGSVTVNGGQTVTTGKNVLAATAGSLTVNATTISDIGTGDTFTLNGKNYILMNSAGLFNVTDSKLADTYSSGAVTIGGSETQVVAPSSGVVQLADVTEAKAIVLSNKTASATKLGTVKKSGTTYTLDYAAPQVLTPSTAPVTVNGATYNGTALTLNTTATTSTLTEGTVTLANTESVTTTTGNNKITATEGDGLTVTASGSTVTLAALNDGDIFTVDGTEYKVTSAGLYRLVDKEEQIYNGDADVLGEGSITVAQLTADVWSGISTVEDDAIVIDDKTLANGESTKLTNEDGSKVYGELSRDANGKYTLTKTDDTTDNPTGITINEVTAAIDSDFASVPVTTVNADDSKTTFTATPTKNAETFTVDATGNAPALTNVKEVELTSGALAAAVNQPVTLDDGKVITPTSGTMTINSDGVSDLDAGDEFTVDGDSYKVIDGVGLFNATDKTLVDDFTDTFNFGATETQILAPNSSGQLELDAMTDTTAQVFDSDTSPTKKLGIVTKADDAYTVDFATPVKMTAGNFSVNGKDYTATSDVVIQSDGTTSTLTQGTVSLAVDDTVTTTASGTVIKAVATGSNVFLLMAAADTSNEVITVTVNADGTISIGDLGAGDVFTVNGAQYKFATAGLMNSDGDIWTGADFTDSLTLTALENADNWTEVLEVTGGNLSVDANTLAADNEVILVDDADDPTVTYGALVKSSDTYTLATDDSSATLNAIAIDNTTVNIDGALATVPVTANDNATFTVTPNKAKETFTVDATTENPALTDNVKSVTLTAGTITAAVKQPVTIGDSTVTPATINGTMTIGTESIGGLTAGDEFTVDGDSYKVISGVGLFNATDKTLVDGVTDTFNFGTTEAQIITPNSSGQIELSSVTGDKAQVFDSDTAPTKKLGTVTKADSVYTIDYAAKVLTPSTSPVTVNGATYNGSSLTLDTTATTSTLTAGTVTLANAESVTTTTGNTVTDTAGDGLTVTAAGDTVTIGGMNAGDVFTVNGSQYKFATAGLMNSDGDIWTGDDFTDSLTLTALENADNWTETLEVTGGNLSVDANTLAADDEVILVDDANDPTVTYGALVKSGDTYTLATDDNSATLNAIAIDNTTVNIDGALSSVPITANDNATFTVTPNKAKETFTVDATTENPALTDNVKAVTLTDGTITAAVKQPVTVGDSTVTPATINGTMTIGTDSIGGLTAGDEFTVDGDSYKVISGVGLFNATDKTLVDDFTDTFNFGATETQILAPNSSGQVELDAMTDTTAQVFDSDTAPTKKLGTVAKSDDAYTVDFATPVKMAAGSFSVNGVPYTATSDVVIQSDGTTSTLTQGTVSLAADDSVTTTASGTVIKATATAPKVFLLMAAADTSNEVITVTVNADGTISIGDLGAGDVFTVNGSQYKFATAGLLNSDGDIWTGADFTDSLTVTALENADNWTETLEVTGGNLSVDANTLATDDEVILVDDADDPTVTYGALVKSGDTYTLATDNSSATLNAIAIDNTTVNIDGALASVPVTANDNATFTVTPNKTKETFTVDATTEAPALTDNVKAVALTDGTITAAVKQPVTVGDSTVTPATINGTMTIGIESIGGLTAGDEFTVDGDSYKVISGVGLFNATDKTLVDGVTDTFSFGATEMQIITPNSSGQIELSAVTGDKAIVFDSDTAPTTKLGTVTKSDTAYTVDFATPVKMTAGSFSVNGQPYTATTEAVIQSDGTTSTLTQGTVSLAADDSVTPTGNDTVTATSGDGLTVKVSDDTVTVSGMNDGDTFSVGEAAYKVAAAGLLNGDNKIWTGSKDYTAGLTTTDLATAENWTEMLSAPDGALTVKPSTLAEGDEVIVVDNTKNPTKTYGTLTKDSDGYTLTKGDDDETLSSLTDSGTVIDVDNDLAKVPVTTVVSDGTEATFTVTPAGGTDYFTVDATGTVPYIDNAGAVEVLKGKITAGDGISVTAADGAQDVDISAGDGTHDVGNKTVKIDGMGTDEEGNKNTVDFGTDSNGNLNSISGLKKGATVTVDGHTYTAPFDDATLKFNDNDGWYFDGYTLEEYTVTVDSAGNVSVDEGVQFSLVVASGKTLDTGGTVKFAANTAKTPITVINKGTTGLNVSDHTGDKLAANLGMTDGVKFSGNGTEIESLSDVAGATFTLDRNQSLTGSDATIMGGADDTAVLIAGRGKTLDIDKAATVNAPAATELLLGNATYNLNGVELTTGDNTEASLNADGVTVDLADNDPLTFNGMTLGTSGSATFDTSGNVSLTSGATAANANGNTLTINGTVGIDDKTVTVAEATKVTATANGLNVGEDTLTVTGDEDGYIINISASSIIGLGDIGSANGVTVGGLDDATVATDKASSLTVDKTFSAPAEVTYTVADGKLVSVTNAESISGDFSGGFTVNGTNYTVKGGTATVNTSGNIQTGAGTYTISGHTFTTSQPTTFTMNNSSVTGAQLDDDGNFAVHQDETSFNIDGSTLTFNGNDNPVTVGTASGIVTTANGVDGLIDGLTDATVYDVSTATINGTPIGISGGVVDVPVVNGVIGTILGLDAGATVNIAPNLTLTATANGTFTFVDDSYNVNDTVDATFDFITDSNSRVININGLSGILSGALDSINVNGQPFASTSDNVTLATDGKDITAVLGLSSGTAIAGSLSKATMTLPEGSVTINGAPFTLAGDSNGVELSGDGTVISGLAKDATLTVGAADTYNINGKDFTATAGQAYTVNREGVYPINASLMPITESTAAEDILALGASSIYIAPSVTGSQSIAFDSGNNVALIDSADAPTSVKTGTGTDSVVARHGAQATVDVEDGTPIIVATKGKVTLDNYNDNADIQTFEYTDITSAVMNNDIKFGDGTMSIGDAVISFGTSAASTGATFTDIIGATGDKQPVGFTHTNGGTLDTRNSSDNYILKGNYAQSSSDTQKGNGSSIAAGSGNDTVLVGADDTVDAGGGANQIYITDPSLRGAGATIALTSGTNTVHGFNPGFTATSDAIKINDLAALEIGFGNSGLTMASGNAQLMFDGMAVPTVTVAATSDSLNPAAPYELKLTDGTTTYNAAIAQDGKDLAVVNGSTADVFIGADNTGLSFNEYTGAVAVNLGDNAGTLDSSAAQIYGVDKVALGSGNSTLIGAENVSNTLIAGTGNGSIWSDSGNDLMRGNTSADKTGSTDFFYAGGDGHDTIDGFDFMASASDTSADELVILPDARVTAVNLSGDDVVIGFNDGTDDLLTITDAKDTPFLVNGLITKVDDNVEFDGFTECYVGSGDRPTLTVGEGMGEVDIFLGDDEDTQYLSDIAVLDASAANGEMNFLAGNDTDNLIIGGSGENAIWGGDSFSNDTLVGGSGKNTFFFAAENGNDVIQNAKDGDVVDLTYLDAEQFAAVEVTSDGVAIDLTDGSHLDVQSNAAVEYKLGDGNTYLVDHDAGEFNRKEN